MTLLTRLRVTAAALSSLAIVLFFASFSLALFLFSLSSCLWLLCGSFSRCHDLLIVVSFFKLSLLVS